MSRFRGLTAPAKTVLLLLAMAGTLFATALVAQAAVTEEVRLDVPLALDGQVWAVEQVGSAVVVGGNFTQVQVERGGAVVNQAGIFAYDLDSGQFLEDFRPILGSQSGEIIVRDIEPTPDGQSLYIGGRFTTINDRSDGQTRVRNRIALLDLDDGRLDRNFALGGVDAQVLGLALGAGNQLYVGGNFDEVFDLGVNRPPIFQAVGGLARFDATTGAFDEGFRYETTDSIGRPLDANGNGGQRNGTASDELLVDTFGVARIDVIDDRLAVAHRGAEIFDRTSNQTHDAAGLAIIDVGNGGNAHSVMNFRALHPDPNDAVQPFYHALQCAGRGVQIRDMDFQYDWLVIAHQGADSGAQCDTVVRFPVQNSSVRPDWVARAFDSVFSVEVDGNDIYIGGHFRFLVNASAPSPYPGIQRASVDFSSQTYIADPNGTSEGSIRFREDLVEPGYVFPVGQIGLLNATTGFADPSFTPQSDADLGVLELTAIDRGLLLGQDTSRINDFNVGRSAFFDDAPNAGDPRCSVDLNGAGTPVVSWTNIGDVNQWNVAANGSFVGSANGNQSQFTHNDARSGETLNYELRYNRNGLSFTDTCGSVSTDVLTLACTAVLNNDQVTISWNDANWNRVSIRANGRFLAEATAPTTFVADAAVGATTYGVRAFSNGEAFNAECTPEIVVGAPGLTCSAVLAGNQVTVSWNDGGWDRVSVRRDGSFIAQVDAGTTYAEAAPIGDATYVLRAFIDGNRVDANCGTVTGNTPVLTCTETTAGGNITLSWNDVGANSYQVRNNGSWIGETNANTTTFTTATNGGDYSIRYRLGGQQFNANCG